MPKFPKLGDNATVPEILKMSPEAGAALMEVHEAVMRGPSPLSPGERELIAAYVSGVNECRYCRGVHAETAKAFGLPSEAVDKMFDDLEYAGLDDKMKPVLRLARKLTEAPASVAEADAQAVYDAGWDEQALHDVIMVVSLFNLMNRLLEGHGVHGHDELFKQRGPMLKEHGYLPLIRLLRPASDTAA
jgi:uncharacterized peroxidase-related enzyme